MIDPTPFEFPLSRQTSVYLEIRGVLPSRIQLRALIVLLEAHFAMLDDPDPIPRAAVLDVNAKRGRRITAEMQDAMLRLFNEGKSLNWIKREMGVSTQTIASHLRLLGVLGPPAARFKRVSPVKDSA